MRIESSSTEEIYAYRIMYFLLLVQYLYAVYCVTSGDAKYDESLAVNAIIVYCVYVRGIFKRVHGGRGRKVVVFTLHNGRCE